MRDLLDGLGPSRNVARRMHELEAELRQARTQLRRHSKSPETLGRWGLETPAAAQQEEGWFITYLDMMTLLLVVMIVMLAFSGTIGSANEADSVDGTPAVTTTYSGGAPAATEDVTANAARSAQADAEPGSPPLAAAEADSQDRPPVGSSPQAVNIAGGPGLLPGGLGFLPGKSALGDTQTIPGHAPATPAADAGPLPPDATVLPSIDAAVSLAELYPGWAADDLSASFVGPPRPADYQAPQLLGSETPAAMAASGKADSALATATGKAAAFAETVTDSEAGTLADPADNVALNGGRGPSEGESLAAGLALGHLGNDVEVVVNERSVSFRVNSEILFDSSQADLSRPGLSVLRKIVAVLADTNHDVTVEGHTDAVPVRRNVRYPSNWELSSSRAGSVVRYLQANGIDKTRLKAIGYADSRPIDDNHTPEGRARNRRVELIIEKHD